MPNLENLRKQAKLVLRWHRDRYYPVAAQIRSLLPRFRHLSDPEILEHPFKLADAQRAAVFYGQVKRAAARLNLKHMDRPVIDPELRDREQLLSADMVVDTAEEIKQLYIEFQQAGVEFQQTLMRQPWGAKNFVVKDPDGNLLLFAGPAE
jgi:glyoxalase/bleomycin resistance protein/dioxygenase superfamily protein